MRRRTFLSTLPAGALIAGASTASAQVAPPAPGRPTEAAPAPARPEPFAGVGSGDRITGAPFAGRSTVWGAHGAAATAHPAATLIGVDTLRRGGSAVDAAIAINAALGFLEPVANGIGGDAFCMLWDPARRKVVGMNGSGNSPRGLSLETARSRAVDGYLPKYGAVTVNVPGTVDAWWSAHQRYGKLPWAEVLLPVAELCEQGVPVPQVIAYYLERNMAIFDRSSGLIEENDNRKAVYAPGGRVPGVGEVFANPFLGRTYRLIAEGGRDAFYDGPLAEAMERYFRRIGGWMTRADLAAHRTEWVEPIRTTYRGVEVYGLGPNTQGLSTNQILNVCEQFDLAGMGFQSAASIHHQAEAKRLAFEDRARFFADPRFAEAPVEWLNSKAYAAERARLIRPDRVMDRVFPGDAPTQGDTTYFSVADKEGMMVSWIQSNYRGMGSGLAPDDGERPLGFMFQDRGELFSLKDGSPNIYAPGKRPFHTIIPGFACKDGEPWMAFGVMGGGMQPQGQAQIVINMVDYGLEPQAAGDAPRWQHYGSSEPTGQAAEGTGVLHLESGVPEATKAQLAAMGWTLGPPDGGFGGYQNVVRQTNPGGRWTYGAATEMRKDGIALAY